MVNIYKFHHLIAISFILGFISCSQTVTLKVLVEDPALRNTRQPINFYLLDKKNVSSIEQIRALNQMYFQKSLADVRDTLRILKREFALNENAYQKLSPQIETDQHRLTVDYCKNMKIEIVRVQKLGDVWKFWTKIDNNGAEMIDGLYITLKYDKDRLVTSGFYPIELLPNQSEVIDQIDLNLGQRISLTIRLSSHPGGFAELPKAIYPVIDSVKSDFRISLEENRLKLNALRNKMEEIGILIDEYPTEKSLELQQRIANPINHALENNLKEKMTPLISKAVQDTVRYTDLKKGTYLIIAYTTPGSITQWHRTIDLESDQLIKFNSKNRTPFFYKITEDIVAGSQAPDDTSVKRK